MTSLSSLYHSNRKSRFFRCKFWVCFLIFLMCILPIFGSSTKIYANHIDSQISKVSQLNIGQDNDIVNEDSIIFEGNASALDITDYGNSYKFNQEVSVNNESRTNLEYYLDSEHGWKVSEINNEIENIYDTRNWIKNNDFKSPIIFKKTLEAKTADPYENNRDEYNYNTTINEPNARFMRVHFDYIEFEQYYDFLYVFNKSGIPYLIDDVNKTNVFSPWIPGDTIHIGYHSDALINASGYKIDYYEFLNDSSNININNDSWAFNFKSMFGLTKNGFGSGMIGGISAMHVDLYSYYYNYGEFYYQEGAFSEIYQNFTIPRGKVIDCYFEFDYFIERGMQTNENFMYIEINNEKVYRFGLRDIISSGGRRNWINTGKFPMALWINSTNIFNPLLMNQNFNISLGIESGAEILYSGFEDAFTNIIWFDNISLVLTTQANSTQSDIKLTFDNTPLYDNVDWASSSITLNGEWKTNPVEVDINTSSPNLDFKMDTILSGYHNDISKTDQLNNPGIIYKILNNGTIYREFYHNLYMPAGYEDFEFIIDKPANWKIISVLDPTLQSRMFENGNFGDSNLKVPKSEAIFPGWWKFVAVSPNYLNLTKTKMLKDGDWVNSEFKSGDSTIIKTNISMQNEILDLQDTNCSLKIYDPNGKLWFNENIQPNSTTGLAQFSRLHFASHNTTGGIYEYSLFWSNGIDVGGIRSSFTMNHNSSTIILKPDIIEENIIDGFYGDIIPLRLYFTDSEKDIPISEAAIHYNYTNNQLYSFEEVLPGVYDAIVNTEIFNGSGKYNISIKTVKTGFIAKGMELQLNLKERINTNPFILPILIGSIGAASILGALSFRSYIWLPKKRKEEEELMAKTQKFKDLQNIQAVVVIHKLSGIPLYTQGYSILEKQKRELFSGFIQAITTISEEFSGSKLIKDNRAKKQYGIERLIELDFKYFYCLIADQDDLRVVLILKNKASERLKEQVSYLCNALILKLSELFDHWDGSLNEFEEKIPDIVEDYFELYYKGDFELAHPKKIAKSRTQENLTTMETRVLNVIYSLSKNKETFKLDYVMEIVSEQKKEFIMLALEGLINRKIIVAAIIEEDKE